MFENFQAFLQNKAMQIMRQRYNIPQNITDPNMMLSCMVQSGKLKFDIPKGMTNPDDIINHLLRTKQITQEQYNQVYSQMSGNGPAPMGRR